MEQINERNFDEMINCSELTVVDFSASWCMPCRMLKPILERVESKFLDVRFYNIDIDESEEIAKRYKIFSVPTIICFRNGKKVDSLVGLNSYDELIKFVNQCSKVSEI